MATTGTSSPMRQINPSICPITGDITYTHCLTVSSQTDRVRMTMKPVHVLPVIFVPGIMGSNLCNLSGEAVWLVNGVYSAGKGWTFKGSGDRQKLLHPGRTKVYTKGETPFWSVGTLTKAEHFQARGWGEVSAMSYKDFLIWLEENLNGGGTQSNHAKLNTVLQQVQDGTKWNAAKAYKPLTQDESHKAVQWYYPVHGFGYNWLDDNAKAAQKLGERITVLKEFYSKKGVCKQVILVTHSMGGLVARYCSELDNEKLKHKAMRDSIAGIVHGVMPTVGAAVAYRRCKVGMWEESKSTSLVIGSNGRDVTAVFAQAPGALQLLPSKQYPVQNWLEVRDSDGNLLPDQPKTDDPYAGVYAVKDKWWNLVKPEWLKPKDGAPIDWTTFTDNTQFASDFHDALADNYHTNTYGFYGSAHVDRKNHKIDFNSFSKITWTMEPGDAPRDKATPSGKQIMAMGPDDVRQSGNNPLDVPGPDVQVVAPDSMEGTVAVPGTYFRMRLGKHNGSGDGTVPAESGRYPVTGSAAGKIAQFFNITGIDHEGAYNPIECKYLTVYAINKIAAPLPLPLPTGGKA
jgi:pimeloyl-ACP methyl ester carboxylesterase